jgi:hypothetical protein
MPPSACSSSGDSLPLDWQQVQTLGVADVVMTILEARKAMPTAMAAAVYRSRHCDGYRVFVSLLESSPSTVPDVDVPDADVPDVDGAVAIFVARELRKDLADAFGIKDVFILQ